MYREKSQYERLREEWLNIEIEFNYIYMDTERKEAEVRARIGDRVWYKDKDN